MGYIPTGSPTIRHQPSSAEASSARPSYSSSAAQLRTDAVELTMQCEEPFDERENNWRCRLHCLEEWICLLLIKNQELRMSLLNSGTNHQFGEFDQ